MMKDLKMLLIAAAVLAAVLIMLKIYSRLSLGRCTSPVCLVGKTALVTGGNSGIGYHTALALAGRGCRVIIADKENCDDSREEIISETGNSNVIAKYFDLASLKSVRQLATDLNETEERLDILVNNAGTCSLGNSYTEDGLHIGMQVNHFGSFLLTHLLVGLLKRSAPSRIIFVSSTDAFFSNIAPTNINLPKNAPVTFLSQVMAYWHSKLCNIVTSNELAKKLEGGRVTANSVHPGLADTPLFKNTIYRLGYHDWVKKVLYFGYQCTFKPFAKTIQEAAETVVHLAVAQEVENVTGKFFVDCRVFLMPSLAKDPSYSRQVWDTSEKLVKLSAQEKL